MSYFSTSYREEYGPSQGTSEGDAAEDISGAGTGLGRTPGKDKTVDIWFDKMEDIFEKYRV